MATIEDWTEVDNDTKTDRRMTMSGTINGGLSKLLFGAIGLLFSVISFLGGIVVTGNHSSDDQLRTTINMLSAEVVQLQTQAAANAVRIDDLQGRIKLLEDRVAR